MDKELVTYFIEECKTHKEWEERYKSNVREFDDYFKYSGMTEPNQILISHWKYDQNHKCDDIHEQFIKVKEYEENKKNTSELSKGPDTYHWNETTNSVWSD
tara:strand:- start:3241 stop:3543 length:303 start_codon:yes stop_codon:yes gene_type:complete